MSLKILDTSQLIIDGRLAAKAYADLHAALVSVEVRETITGASTCTLTVKDPNRTLLRSGLFVSGVTFQLDGAGFQLVAVRKSSDGGLEIDAEDMAVAALRKHTNYRKAAAGTVSRVGFCQLLMKEEPWIVVNAAPGALAKVELARGSDNTVNTGEAAGGSAGGYGDYGLDPKAGATVALTPTLASKKKPSTTSRQIAAGAASPENTWDTAGRIMGEIGWRVYASRKKVTIAPDSWILAHGTPYTVTESSPGVDAIEFDYDIGKPAASATLTIRTGTTTDFPVGSRITITDQGPANGDWLCETITRTDRDNYATVNLVRPQPVLAEPAAAEVLSNVGNAGDGGYGDYGGAGDTGAAAPDARVEAFVSLALQQAGKKYVWGASGPNTFDCSGLVQWVVGQLTARDAAGFAVERDANDRRGDFPKPVGSQLAICRSAGAIMTVQQAIATRGALLIRGPNEHIAISLGNGKTIEARGKAYGVGSWDATGRNWTTGGWVPGFKPAITTGRDGGRGD